MIEINNKKGMSNKMVIAPCKKGQKIFGTTPKMTEKIKRVGFPIPAANMGGVWWKCLAYWRLSAYWA